MVNLICLSIALFNILFKIKVSHIRRFKRTQQNLQYKEASLWKWHMSIKRRTIVKNKSEVKSYESLCVNN